MQDFPRTRRRGMDLPLTAMIDVVFILIIFFMLTTSFMKMESMELLLPSVTPLTAKRTPESRVVQILLQNDGSITYAGQPSSRTGLRGTLNEVFASNPDQRVLVMVDSAVTLQSLVEVMDTVYLSGGKNVFVKEWQPAPAGDSAPAAGDAS